MRALRPDADELRVVVGVLGRMFEATAGLHVPALVVAVAVGELRDASALLLSAFRLAGIWSDLPRAIRTVTDSPARAAGLRDRGRLEMGLRADILRVRRLDRTPVIRSVWTQGHRVG